MCVTVGCPVVDFAKDDFNLNVIVIGLKKHMIHPPHKDAGDVGCATKDKQHKHGQRQSCCQASPVVLDQLGNARPDVGTCHDPSQH